MTDISRDMKYNEISPDAPKSHSDEAVSIGGGSGGVGSSRRTHSVLGISLSYFPIMKIWGGVVLPRNR